MEALGPPTLHLLEVASAAGVEFSAAELAAAADSELAELEEACDELARRQLLLARAGVSEWPDGTLAARFRFRHGLHRDVLYARLSPSRRRELHARIGRRLEQGYAGRESEAAPLLARHFALGGDATRAVLHYRAAVEAAARRHAGHEAKQLAERALELLPRLPEAERGAAELGIRFALAPALPSVVGFADPAVEENLVRAQWLCERTGDGERRLAVLWSRCHARFQAGEPDSALALAQQLLDASRELARPAFEVLAHDALAFSYHKLCRFAESQQHAEQVLALYDPERHADLAEWIGQDVAVDAAVSSAFNLWYLGRVAEAGGRIEEAVGPRAAHGARLQPRLRAVLRRRLPPRRRGSGARARCGRAGDRARPGGAAPGASRLCRADARRPRSPRRRIGSAPWSRRSRAAAPGAEDAARATGTTGVRALFVGALSPSSGCAISPSPSSPRRSRPRPTPANTTTCPACTCCAPPCWRTTPRSRRELETALATAAQLGLRMAELEAATALARLRARCGRRDEARQLLAPRLAGLAGEPDVPLLRRARTLLAELETPEPAR